MAEVNWPRTREEAVARTMQLLTETERAQLRNANAQELLRLNQPVGNRVRTKFGLWEGNGALKEAFGSITLTPEEVSLEILRETQKFLRR
jgi:hypothetical protein